MKYQFFPKVITIIAAISCLHFVSAGQKPLIELVKQKYSLKSTMQSQFDLNIFWSVREKQENKSGKIIIAPNDHFRVELGNQTMISDGQNYWEYNKKSGEASVKKLSDIDSTWHPSKLFTSYINKYSFKETSRTSTETILTWKADSGSQGSTKEITLWVKTSGGIVSKVRIVDSSGNIQTLTFKNTIFGKVIPQEVFRFDAPKNVKIVDNR
jgi:outer membrane lipoprotein-sorting protein